ATNPILQDIASSNSTIRCGSRLRRRLRSPYLRQHVIEVGTPRAPIVGAVTADVIVMHDAVLVEDLMKQNAAVAWLVFERAEADEQVVHLLVDGRIVQEPRCALFRIGISGAQNAERGK